MTYKHWKLERETGDQNAGLAWAILDTANSSTNTLGAEVMAELGLILDECEKNPPSGLIIKGPRCRICGVHMIGSAQAGNCGPRPPPTPGSTKMSAATLSGYSSANATDTPPPAELPTKYAFSIPNSSNRPRKSSTLAFMPYGFSSQSSGMGRSVKPKAGRS